MKPFHAGILASLMMAFCHGRAVGQTATTASGPSSLPAPTSPTVVENELNSRVWQWQTFEPAPGGRTVSRTHQVIEMATGLNHLVNGQYVESSDEIQALPQGGAEAVNAQQQANFPGDIYEGTIRLWEPDGTLLESRPLGLSYDDGKTTVIFAQLTNSVGYLASSNSVVYPGVFVGPAGFTASLRYTFTRAGLEQDVIMAASQPPAPEDYQMSSASSKMQVLTEFFNAPVPVAKARMLPEQGGLALTDNSLNFGSMEMIPGRAFSTGAGGRANDVPVAKTWMNVGGRQILVEEAPVTALASAFSQLPPLSVTSGKLSPLFESASTSLPLPPQRLTKHQPSTRFAQKPPSPSFPALVMDYITVNSSVTNTVYQGDETFYISGPVYAYGSNTFEGGTVLKYAAGGSLTIMSPQYLEWEGGKFRPVVCTAKDDNTIGQSFGTGSPSGYYGNPMLEVIGNYYPSTIQGVRFAYAATAYEDSGAADSYIYDAQIVHCQNAVNVNNSGIVSFGNALFAYNQTNLVLNDAIVTVQNATFFNSSSLAAQGLFFFDWKRLRLRAKKFCCFFDVCNG